MSEIPTFFQATITDLKPQENSGFSTGRARVFYKGLNRNRTYITPTFAEKLIQSSVGCPVVGLWDSEKKDFTDHTSNERKRAYGYVSEHPNFSWELFAENGEEREYACFDIVLWTKAFEEANYIIGKSLSMELNPDSICGSWYTVQGQTCFMFNDGEMLGFCVLGDDVEPCFEDASFFSLGENDIQFFYDLRQKVLSEITQKGENDNMENEPIITEEVTPVDVVEEEVTPTEEEETEIVEENKEQVEDYTIIREDDFDEEIAETKVEIDTNVEEKDNEYVTKIFQLEEQVAALVKENAELVQYKNEKLAEERKAVLDSYADILDEEDYAHLDTSKYSLVDLKDKLAAIAFYKFYKKQKEATNTATLIKTDYTHSNIDTIGEIIKKYKEK